MKKLIYIAIALASLTMASCTQNRDEVRVYGESAAEKAIALGAMEGTWKRVSPEGEGTAAGTVTFAACTVDSIIAKAGADNVAMIHAVCTEFSLDNTGVVNVMHAGDDIIFSNNKTVEVEKGGFGAPIYGRIQNAYGASPKIIVDFKIEQRDGRKLKTFEYSFR